jgi:hypothetical protein
MATAMIILASLAFLASLVYGAYQISGFAD